MKPLTPRQQKILAFLQAYIKEHGYPPSIRDIMQGCQVSSTAVVDYNLDILARLSYIRRDPGIPRGIVVLRSERSRT